MFTRVKTVHSQGRTYRYLQIVENYRDGDRVRQRIVGNLGRLEELQKSGDLERLVTQLVEHCPGVRLLRARAEGSLRVVSDRLWGPVLVFERLWQELGLDSILRTLTARRRLGFDFERMIFAQVLQRFLEPGSDLRGSKWIETLEGTGLEGLRLPHFYRSLGVLWGYKATIEESLYRRGLDLFNQDLDLVFFDTTTTYFEGTQLRGWAKLGKSKDHRPDHLQLAIGVVMRRDGLPIACEIWPGNTNDATTLVPMIDSLKKRFRLRKVILVCDRGMVSKANLNALDAAGFEYIVGTRMRGLLEVRDDVLARAGRYREVDEGLSVKEVWVEDRRYVICFNPEQAEKDRRDREAILEKMRAKLKAGRPKRLINNRGYRRFLKVKTDAATIDEAAVQRQARYDGKYVLRTTTNLPASEVAVAYKQLTWIERLWRELKDVVEVRPIYHWKKKENVKGHIFTCFLALYLAALLRRKLAEAGQKVPWDHVIRDLSQVRAVTADFEGQKYRMRSPMQGCAGHVLAAVGAKVPPLAEALSPAPQ